ncbi:MAG: glucose 1-dehydrogenase [Dehalococcoidia bacterium]
MPGRLDGKVAVVTGGASGIGEATVRLFVQEGARVVIADVQDQRGLGLAEELGTATAFHHTNVVAEADIAGAVDLAVSRFGRLDCMFNNAGIVGAVGPIDETPADEYDFTMNILLRGPFLGMKHAARVMKAQRSGCIISTSSIAGLYGGLGPHVYAAAKTALIGLTKNVAAELGPYGVRVNCIAPGNMATQMVADVMGVGDIDNLDEAARRLAERSPLKDRPGRASDIAHAALWLASDDAGYVNGHTLTVDGGLTVGVTPRGAAFQQHVPLIRERGGRGLS